MRAPGRPLAKGESMIRKIAVALCLAALAACGESDPGTGSAVKHESQSAPPQTTAKQAMLDDAQRAQLVALIGQILDSYGGQLAQGHRRADGFAEDIVAPLQPGRDHRANLPLKRGVAYRILGGCDNECNDVDLELLGADGAVLQSDLLTDDYPVVNFTPTADGNFTLRIILKTCTVGPCYVGARVLQPA